MVKGYRFPFRHVSIYKNSSYEEESWRMFRLDEKFYECS